MNILFVCSQGRLRSRTGADYFRSDTIKTRHCGTDHNAEVNITQEMIDECDIVVCMEWEHLLHIHKHFRCNESHKPVHVFTIADEYDYMDSDLIQLLKIMMKRYNLVDV